MSKVYIVTAGSYSDYHILGAFLDKDKAERYVEIHDNNRTYYDWLNVEEYNLLDESLECSLERDIYRAKCNISNANNSNGIFFKKIKTFDEAGCCNDVTRYYSKDCYDGAESHLAGEIYIVRSYKKGKYTEEHIKSVMTKVINDLIALVSDFKNNYDADDDQIKELIENAM